jgi:hypothetical protein
LRRTREGRDQAEDGGRSVAAEVGCWLHARAYRR